MTASGWKKHRAAIARSTEARLELLWWLYEHRADGWAPLATFDLHHAQALERRGYLVLFELGAVRAALLTRRGVRVAEALRSDGCGMWRVA